MSFISFLKSKIFLINIFAALLLLVVLGWLVLQLLSSYTLHGETVTVPDLKGYKAEELNDLLAKNGLRYNIIDSVYDDSSTPGTIVEQEPKPDLQVKANRMLYLTINATEPPQVQMPNLIDFSLRQAIAIIESSGLNVGDLKYIPDFAHNAVLSQEFKGKKIEPGEILAKGSTIDLVLGEGISNEMVAMPYLINLSYNEAVAALNAASLNIGSVVKDKTVKDSTLAKVYKQVPAYGEDVIINQGASVDIYISQSPVKIANVSVDE